MKYISVSISLKLTLRVLAVVLVIHGHQFQVMGQDPQFSQQYSAPLLLNPALSGADNSLRGALNYRTQWNAVSDPFTTVAGSFDVALNQRQDPRKQRSGKPGLGIAFVSDRAGNLRNTSIAFSGGYHVYLNKSSSLGAALSIGYHTQGLKSNTGKWGSQYNGMQYSADIPHGENLQAMQESALDIGGGLVYVFRKPAISRRDYSRRELTLGIAGHHLGRIPLNVDDIYSGKVYPRISAFATAAYGLGNSKSSLEPAVYFHRQGPAQMLMAGMAFRKVFGSPSVSLYEAKETAFSLGGYYRFGDAIVANLVFEWSDLSIGLAYDINSSKLSRYTSGRGAVEVSLRYQIAATQLRR